MVSLSLLLLLTTLWLTLCVVSVRGWLSPAPRGLLTRIVSFAALAVTTVPLAFVARWMLWPTRSVRGCPIDERVHQLQHPTLVLDRSGNYVATADRSRGRFVPLSDLRPGVAAVFVGTEDKRFWSWYHFGIDPVGVVTAALSDVVGQRRGASTIPMQAARVLCEREMPPDHTWKGKLSEAAMGLWLVDRLGKKQVLGLYLNGVYLGRGRNGLDAAADEYFAKRAEQLSVAEAAQLAALVRAPSDNDPGAVSTDVRDELRWGALERAAPLLKAEGVAVNALTAPVRLAPKTTGDGSVRDFVRAALRGASTTGDTVRTTLDMGLQLPAEREMFHLIRVLDPRGTTSRDPLIGLFVAADAPTGEVLAYVSRRWDDPAGPDWVRDAWILPASTIKGVLYPAAIDFGGVSPDEPLADLVRRQCPGLTIDPWFRRLRGSGETRATVEQAFAPSANVLGPCLLDAIPARELRALSIRGVVPSDARQPVAGLGIVPVRPLDLLMSYGAIANGGRWLPPSYLSSQDHSLERRPEKLFSVGAANATLTALEGVVQTGTARPVRRYLDSDIPAAGKTGTAPDNDEFVFVGISGRIVSLIWLGHARPRPILRRGSAGRIVAPAWARIMERYFALRGGETSAGGAFTVW